MVKIAPLASWNNYPKQICTLHRPERYRQFSPDVESAIARGLGRSYGDAALNEGGEVFLSERLNRILVFDPVRGVLRAEAGVSLDEILRLIVPRGWFLPVSPGTRFVSLGGAVASDVHGKNHHCDGSFGAYVGAIQLALPGAGWVDCSPTANPEIFWATVGGMGLTGFIGEVELQLRPIASAYVRAQHHAASNLDGLFDLFADPDRDAPYTVAWIDCLSSGNKLGRGVLMTGHHAALQELPIGVRSRPYDLPAVKALSVPVNLPGWALNPLSVSLFNEAYFAAQARKRAPFIADLRSFFYPLDNIHHWNRIYGAGGFVQYQCVIPEPGASAALRELLKRIASSRHASFLAVLKRMGPAGSGMLSFPMLGYTLALDLSLRDPDLFKLLDELDELVIEHGGRVYLAKDARLSAASFRKMYPRYGEWLAVKNRLDPDHQVTSSMARRLKLGSAA